MNIAFQALFFFVLLLPGFLLRSTYNGRISKELVLPQNYPPYSREAIRIFIYALALNVVWVSISNLICSIWDIYVDLPTVIYLLMGNYGDVVSEKKSIEIILNFPRLILFYFVSLYAVSAAMGLWLHKLIRRRGWDKRYTFFRFNNDWHYLLTGEIREFPDAFEDPREVDLVIISAVVDIAGKAVLYAGVVIDYTLDGRGNLKDLKLARVFRRSLEDDRVSEDDERPSFENDERYYRIEGDFFVLDCANARNLNVEYIFVDYSE